MPVLTSGASTHQRCLDSFVEARHGFTRTLVVLADQRERRVGEVPHRIALPQELGVDGHPKLGTGRLAAGPLQNRDDLLLQCPGEHGAANGDHVIVIGIGESLPHRPGCGQQVLEVETAVGPRRGPHTDQRDIGFGDRLGGRPGGAQAPRCDGFRQPFGDAVLDYR